MEQKNKIIRWAALAGVGTLISRVLGLVREMAMASLFGTGLIADAFSVAFRFPALLHALFGESGFGVAFLPRYSQERIRKSQEDAFVLASSLAIVLAAVLLLILMLVEFLAPYFVSVFAWGWQHQPEKFALTIKLLRILFIFVIFMSYDAWVRAILNAHKIFFIPALAPALMNFAWIAGATFALWYPAGTPQQKIQWVCIAILIGGFLQVAFQLPLLKKIGFSFHPNIKQKVNAIIDVGKTLIPVLWGLAVIEVNYIVDILLASFLSEGSVASLTYAHRIIMLPLGLVGVSLKTATLPTLADQVASQNDGEFKKTLSFSLRSVWSIMFPISVFLVSAGQLTVELVFERGSFSGNISTPMTTYALVMYSFSVLSAGSSKIALQAFYSHRDMKTPVIISTITMIVNVILSLLFIDELKHGGLALATTLAGFIHFTICLRILAKKGRVNLPELTKPFITIAISSISAGILTYIGMLMVKMFIYGKSFPIQLTRFTIVFLIWGIAIFVMSKIFKAREINTAFERIFSKFLSYLQ